MDTTPNVSSAKLKLLKILAILMDTDEDNPLTALQIGTKLHNIYGIDAERKSICRDINVLIDAGYGVELCVDNKKGYYMADRDFEDWELKILIDAVLGAKFLTDDNTKKLVNKLKLLASVSSRKVVVAASPLKLAYKSGN